MQLTSNLTGLPGRTFTERKRIMNPEEVDPGRPDPFPEPRTIPSGWDAASLSNAEPDEDVPGVEIEVPAWPPEPFREPRTIPSGWNSAAIQ